MANQNVGKTNPNFDQKTSKYSQTFAGQLGKIFSLISQIVLRKVITREFFYLYR